MKNLGKVSSFRALALINSKNELPNSGKDPFFFREHLDFGTKIEKYEVCLKSIGTVCFAQTTLATVIKALFFKMAQCLVVVKM